MQSESEKKDKKNVIWLGVTSFFTDVSSEMIFAVLPIFLKSVLGAPFAVIGLIEGVAEGVSSFLKYFSGRLSDALKKRKPLAFAGYSFSTLSKLFLIIANSWPVVLLLRILDRVGKGVRTSPRDALISESVSESERGKYFGLHRAMDSAGAFLGVAVVLFIFWFAFRRFSVPEEQVAPIIRNVFLLAFIPAFLALIPFFFIKDVIKKEEGGREKARQSKADLFDFKGFSPSFYKGVAVLAFLAFGNISYAFFILKSQAVGVEIFLLPALYLVYNFFYALFSYPAGRFSDRLGRVNVLTFGFLTLAAVLFAFGLSQSGVLMWGFFALYGFSLAIVDSVARAFVADIADPVRKGESFGLYHMTAGIMSVLGNLVFGFLWDRTDSTLPFVIAGVLVTLSAILLIILFRGHEATPQKVGIENFRAYRP
ncbi:MAG: major facilitator superfamily protein [Parcubacteria group bacterium Gr01-1014_30]|nr:MAG: major facilitator superfamily protein [Parcubacteria group bacterium Gr01-1014_30]